MLKLKHFQQMDPVQQKQKNSTKSDTMNLENPTDHEIGGI